MADISYWDDTLTEEIAAIQQIVDKIPSIRDPMERSAALDRAKSRLRSAVGTKRSFKMEIRLVQDVNARRKHESKLGKHEQTLRSLQADTKALEAEADRGELFIEASANDQNGGMGNASGMDGVRAGNNMLNEAAGLQDKTQESLANTRNMIAQSKEVGVATLEELERQRDVIHNIESGVERIDDNLARAELLLKQFGKRMATDNFIQCFAVINCLLLLGVIIYAIVKRGGFGGGESAPESPVRALLLRRP